MTKTDFINFQVHNDYQPHPTINGLHQHREDKNDFMFYTLPEEEVTEEDWMRYNLEVIKDMTETDINQMDLITEDRHYNIYHIH